MPVPAHSRLSQACLLAARLGPALSTLTFHLQPPRWQSQGGCGLREPALGPREGLALTSWPEHWVNQFFGGFFLSLSLIFLLDFYLPLF